MKKKYYNKFDAGNSFLLTMICPALLAYSVVFLIQGICGIIGKPINLENNVAINIILTLVNQLGFLLVFYLYSKYKKINMKSAIRFSFKISSKNWLLIILTTIIALFGLNIFLSLFDNLFALIGYNQPTDLPFPLSNGWWLIANIIILVLVPAICEELIFRGIILHGLCNSYGEVVGVIGSAALFALIHLSPVQTVYPFLFGIILALVCLKTNNILTSILIHFFNNLIVVVISYIELNFSITLWPNLGTLWWLWAIIAGIFTFIVMYLLLKKFKTDKLIEVPVNIDDINNDELLENTDINGEKKINSGLWIAVAIGVIAWILTLASYL